MRLRQHSLRVLLVALAATLGIAGIQQQLSARTAQGPGSSTSLLADEAPVDLPTTGTMDERPFFSSRRNPAVAYDRPTADAVAELARKVETGEVKLRFDPVSGYLLSVLEELHVPIESQSVVFSKTSLQSHFISPSNPRALFYSDDVAVGFIRNAPLMELSAFDPQQGVVFYAIAQQQTEQPEIVRGDSCLSCHESRNSLDVPGMLMRSMGVGLGGQTMPRFGNFISDHRSPIEERWGGWYVTGKTGTARHMGNVRLTPDGKPDAASPAGKILDTLASQFDLEGYPSKYSDIAAVMVLNHQVHMTNLLTRVGWETRIALDRQLQHPQDKSAAERLISADVAELADYMLFVDEAPLTGGKFESTSGFATKFASLGPKDKQGRSLRQLDLDKRLMKYPLSYMIYSRAFDQLPDTTREAFYKRLWAVLSGQDKTPKYAKLSAADKAAVASIVAETKTNLPTYFKKIEK